MARRSRRSGGLPFISLSLFFTSLTFTRGVKTNNAKLSRMLVQAYVVTSLPCPTPNFGVSHSKNIQAFIILEQGGGVAPLFPRRRKLQISLDGGDRLKNPKRPQMQQHHCCAQRQQQHHHRGQQQYQHLSALRQHQGGQSPLGSNKTARSPVSDFM